MTKKEEEEEEEEYKRILEKFKKHIHGHITNTEKEKSFQMFLTSYNYTTIKDCGSLSCEQYLLDNGYVGYYKIYGPMYQHFNHLVVRTKEEDKKIKNNQCCLIS